MTFARSFSLDFSSKSPSSIEIWVLQPPPLQKGLLQVSFLGIYRAATLANNFWAATLLWSYSYKKSVINHCYKKVKQRFSTKKRFIKNLLKVSEKNNSDVSRINQIMSKLLILSKRLQFWTCRAFSHFTNHLRHFIIIDHKWKLLKNF